MKKQMLRFLLGFAYVGLVVFLLAVQLNTAYGTAERNIAILEILLLGIPFVIVLTLYIRVTDAIAGQEEERKAAEDGHKAMPVSYEETYAFFLETVQSFGLSEREIEVAWLLYRGYTNRQIGEELFIAETTVKKHVSHIYEKMQITGRKEFRRKVNGE